jgi:hypothetical protein
LAPTRFRLNPFSLAATQGVAVAFLSLGYSDVSIPPVPSLGAMRSHRSDTPLRVPGFPIRTSTDRSSVGSSPWLIAASNVLLRLQAPRHPPLALCSLENKDARARYGILKERAAPPLSTSWRCKPGERPAAESTPASPREQPTWSLPQNGIVRSVAHAGPGIGVDRPYRSPRRLAGRIRLPPGCESAD